MNNLPAVSVPFLAFFRMLAKAIPGTLGGAIAGYVTARRAEKAKRGDRIREEHLNELKSQLLEILRVRINRYYLPVSEHKAGIIERTVIRVNKDNASIAESPYVRSDPALQIIPLRSQQPDLFNQNIGIQLHSEAFERLYADAKEYHYPELIQEIDRIAHDFQMAAGAHLSHVELVKKELQETLKLPPQTTSYSHDGEWADYEELALFIYRHHLGLNFNHLQVHPEGSPDISASSTGQRFVHYQASAKTSVGIKAINEIATKTKGDPTLISAFTLLQPRLNALNTQLEAAIHDKHLPAKCPYT